MKTIEYVRKYKLNEDDHFNHTKFLKDFVNDFNSMLSDANINNDYVRFRRLVDDMKKKWDNINKKTVGQLPEPLWRYFYATTITERRDALFPNKTKQPLSR